MINFEHGNPYIGTDTHEPYNAAITQQQDPNYPQYIKALITRR